MTRVTSSTMHQTVLDGLSTSLSRVQKAQAELASGKRINLYSDAPADASATLRLRAEESDWASYGKAADDGAAWLNTQDSVLQTATTLLSRVRQLALDGATSTTSQTARDSIAAEIDGLREQFAGLANTTYQGQSVFGGHAASAVTLVAGNYVWSGDAGAVSRRITPDMTLQVNGNGNAIWGFGSGNDVFSVLDQIATHLRAGNTAALGGADLGLIDGAQANINDGLAQVGARANVVEAAKTTGLGQIAVLKDTRSSIEDVDIAAAALDMQLAQTGYQAALAAAARLSLPSLVDFLR